MGREAEAEGGLSSIFTSKEVISGSSWCESLPPRLSSPFTAFWEPRRQRGLGVEVTSGVCEYPLDVLLPFATAVNISSLVIPDSELISVGLKNEQKIFILSHVWHKQTSQDDIWFVG